MKHEVEDNVKEPGKEAESVNNGETGHQVTEDKARGPQAGETGVSGEGHDEQKIEDAGQQEKPGPDEKVPQSEKKSRKKTSIFGGKSNKDEIEKLKAEKSEINDKYIRLAAEFDNYKKRTLKEKSDLLKYGSEAVLQNLLPVVDDFERARKSISETSDIKAVIEGIELIYGKFSEFLAQNGLKEIESINHGFNTDFHEAITRFPAPTEEMKGKIIDVIQKGYTLNDKVIRFSKVVVGD